MSNAIEPLPDATRSRLRSTQLLVSLPQMVSELVQNALDAGASQLDVSLDADGWACTVRDNGTGVPRASLPSVAQRYNTSKTYAPSSSSSSSSFGFRGEALASVADVCVLELATRTKADSDCWSVILKGGESLHCGPALRNRVTGRHGTVVCVRDAFYNLPVRRMSHPNPAKTLELVRREMETYALACPHVGFSLENVSSGAGSSKSAGRVFAVPKTMSALATFRRLYGRALADNVDEINVGAEGMRMKGFISLDGAPSRSHQFLYVNHHPVLSSELSSTVDAVFAASTFAKHAYEESGRYTPDRPNQRRSPRKMEKHPVYVLDIALPADAVDNCLEPSKSILQFKELRKLRDFLSIAVKAFLERHGFRTTTLKRREIEENDGSPRKRPKFDRGSAAGGSRPQSPFSTPRKTPLNLRRPNRPLEDDEMEWTDPNTGAVHIVDKRTGTSVLGAPGDEAEAGESAQGNRTIVDTRSLRKRSRGQDQSAMPDWMHEVFANSENPIYRRPKESGIKSTATPSCCPAFTHVPVPGKTAEVSFTRADLRGARVLGQVDRKFVACVLAGGALVLVDQHAADERIRVERFLAELCGGADVRTVELDVEAPDGRKGLPVLLTRREAELLAQKEGYRAAFARWGVVVDVSGGEEGEREWDIRVGEADNADAGEYVQIWVRSVPEVVAEKLVQDNELRDLIKRYLARLESDGLPPTRPPTATWNTVLQYCPSQLVDLANSKACRGAIMFNDTLDLDRCTRLISELADTLFPFQCAHGRPSLAPLAGLDSLSQPQSQGPDWERFICSIETLDVE